MLHWQLSETYNGLRDLGELCALGHRQDEGTIACNMECMGNLRPFAAWPFLHLLVQPHTRFVAFGGISCTGCVHPIGILGCLGGLLHCNFSASWPANSNAVANHHRALLDAGQDLRKRGIVREMAADWCLRGDRYSRRGARHYHTHLEQKEWTNELIVHE